MGYDPEYSRRWREANREKCRKYQQDYRARHPGLQVARAKAYREANPEAAKASARKGARKRRGIVNATGEARTGPCGNRGCPYVGPLHLDHQHGGEIRGWLCGSCNRALGLLKDCPETVLGLHQYIKEGKA